MKRKLSLLVILVVIFAGCATTSPQNPQASTAIKTISDSVNNINNLLGQALTPQKAAGIIQFYLTLQKQHEQDIQKPGLTSQEIAFLNAEGNAINSMLPYVQVYQKWVMNNLTPAPTVQGDKAIASAIQTILQLLTTLK